MRAFRIADQRHPIFDGGGAFRHGGRWNSPGRRVIYCSETYACARLEQLVRLPLGRVPLTHRVVEVMIPDDMPREEVDPTQVPGWNAEDKAASRAYGDAWYDARRSLVLLVLSLAAPGERNILINQEHPDFPKLKPSAPRRVTWDERLFRRTTR